MYLVPAKIWGQLEVIGQIRGPERDGLERGQREKEGGEKRQSIPAQTGQVERGGVLAAGRGKVLVLALPGPAPTPRPAASLLSLGLYPPTSPPSSSLPPGEGVGGNRQCWPGVRHLLEKGEGVGELGTPQERGQGSRPRAGVPQGAGGCSLLVPAPSREVSSRLQEGPHSASQ